MAARGRPLPQHTAVRLLERAEQDREIVSLKRRGLTYTEISDRTGIPVSTARDAVVRATREAQSLLFPEQAMYVAEKLDQLGALLNAVWDDAMAGDVKAVETARHLLSDMSDYTGAKAAIKLEIGESDVDRALRELDAELERRSREAAGQAAPAAGEAGRGAPADG